VSIDPLQLGLPMVDAAQATDVAEQMRNVDLLTAARKFEGYMTQVLVREMRKTVPEGLFTSSAMDIFAGILDEEFSARISESGQLGLAEQLLGGLTGDRQTSAAQLHPSRLMGESGESGESRGRSFVSYANAASENLGSGKMRGRLPVHGQLSSRFGWRNSPIEGHRHHHDGMDIAASKGTRIDAVRSGTVEFAGQSRGYGNMVIIDHGNGLTSRYAHCDELKVTEGDRIRSGQAIATVGSTGRSTGPHLHFEIRQDGEMIDPQEFFGWRK
jgi:murein DD-endopeptidase MepM/ murein hydrolase activator NlpD